MKKIKENIIINENILNKNVIAKMNEYLLDKEKIINDEYIKEFEKSFAKYNNSKYAVAVTNEVAAFHLVLTVLKIKPYEEIILPDLTPISSVYAISYLGAKPVFIDVDKESWNIDISKIEENITEKTRAIIAVHLYGQPAKIKEIQKICQKYNLHLIEDCTYSLGSEISGGKVGSFGIAGCFSLNKNSILNCLGGGIILTNNSRIYERLIFLRDLAKSEKVKYFYSEIGFDYRLSNMQAIIGLIRIKEIDEIIKKKKKIEEEYLKKLSSVEEITLQAILLDRKKVNPYFSLLYQHNKKRNKDAFIKFLSKNKIEGETFLIPITELPMYYSSQKINNNARIIANSGINLPLTLTMKEEEVNYITEKIKEFFKN
ncbi:MAG TPA: DegT/DnrJ/EryC1/StrS family aminotransferase [bacterium]|nr:DegT/DnrJ/EryC1/StrS family aminotransferase [bacterium]HOL48319.1 DegT/DnrJ/EryC1/StrS family aminotransferase [bacterium]HPQ18555.1 DegT/DnrJ/EryC1/StrS family aminotransferase [bacterium]